MIPQSVSVFTWLCKTVDNKSFWAYNSGIVSDRSLKMKVLITTQYSENYGTESDPYWKFKGGSDYFIQNVNPLNVAPGMLVDKVRSQIEYSNPMSQELILDWELVSDDFITEFEKDQLEFGGKIVYPTKVIELA